MMSQKNMGTPVQPQQQEENRYALVNTVAQRAKKILSHDADYTMTKSNHRAIREAMEQVDNTDEEI